MMERTEHRYSAEQERQALADVVFLNRKYPGLVVSSVRCDPRYPHICCEPAHYEGDGAKCCSVCGYPVGIAIDGMTPRGLEILKGLMTAARNLATDELLPPIFVEDHSDEGVGETE